MSWGFNNSKYATKSLNSQSIWDKKPKKAKDAWTVSAIAKKKDAWTASAIAKKKKVKTLKKQKKQAAIQASKDQSAVELEEMMCKIETQQDGENNNGQSGLSAPPALSRPGCFAGNVGPRIQNNNQSQPQSQPFSLGRPSFLPK